MTCGSSRALAEAIVQDYESKTRSVAAATVELLADRRAGWRLIIHCHPSVFSIRSQIGNSDGREENCLSFWYFPSMTMEGVETQFH